MIPTALIVTAILLAKTSSPSQFMATDSPPIPATEYRSIEELEGLAETHIPTPNYLLDYKYMQIYQLGIEIEQGETPSVLYILYSKEKRDFGVVKDDRDLSDILGMIGDPEGYDLLLFMQQLDYPLTKEQTETWAQNYAQELDERGIFAKVIQVGTESAVLKRIDEPPSCNKIEWHGSNWVFHLWGAIPEITVEELINIAESVG